MTNGWSMVAYLLPYIEDLFTVSIQSSVCGKPTKMAHKYGQWRHNRKFLKRHVQNIIFAIIDITLRWFLQISSYVNCDFNVSRPSRDHRRQIRIAIRKLLNIMMIEICLQKNLGRIFLALLRISAILFPYKHESWKIVLFYKKEMHNYKTSALISKFDGERSLRELPSNFEINAYVL